MKYYFVYLFVILTGLALVLETEGGELGPIPNFGDDAELANSVMIGTISAAYAIAVPVGTVLGIAAAPGVIIPDVTLEKTFRFGMKVGVAPVMSIGYVLAYALGTPLYVIESMFWDRPRSLFGKMSAEIQPFRYISPDAPLPSRSK